MSPDTWQARRCFFNRSLLVLFYLIGVFGLARTVPAQSPPCCTDALLLLEADGTYSRSNVLVTFSEAITVASATNVANYRITNTTSGAQISVTKATVTNGHQVWLATSQRASLQNYILVVNRLRDAACNNRIITTNSSIPVV